MKSLKEWLKGYYTPSGQPYTHVSLSGGRYCIPDDQLEQLYELLESSSEIYHLAEKRPEKASNITIDFDLIVKDISLETNHCFDIDFITRVVDLYNSHLFEMGLCHNMYICTYVLYRDSAYCDSKMNTYKDGFHLHYTDFLLDYELQYELRERVVNDLKLCDWMFPTVNSIEGVVDKMAISNHWLLYGCSKPGLQPYKAQYIIYGHQNEKSKLELVPPEFNKNYLINCFSLRNLKAKHLEQPSQPAILLPSDLNLETSEDYVHNLNTVNQIWKSVV